MATITVEEPKSVVETVMKYECDSCGSIKDSERDMYTVFVYDGIVQKHQLALLKQEQITRNKSIKHKEPERKRHLCEHCSAEPSNKQLENSAESVTNKISMFSILLASGVGLFVYHLLTFTPFFIGQSNINSMVGLVISFIVSFIFVLLFSIVCFVCIAYIFDKVFQVFSLDSVDITFKKQQ